MSTLIGKRYRILSKLGSGSIGDVYLAVDGRNNEKVCVKTLRSEVPEIEENFVREFEILSDLRHPGLISVYDFGIDPDSGPFFSMEYAGGGDLSGVKAVAAEDFVAISTSVCQALEYIHNRSIVHGDLKPSNILIDSAGNYRLVDFGLSFISGDKVVSSSGSAPFISPEVIHKQSATNRSDIYSLGLLFYELIFGKPFYEGTAGEIISQKLNGAVLMPEIPGRFGGKPLRELLQKMIEHNPRNRVDSAGKVLDEIEEIFGGKVSLKIQRDFPIEKSIFIGREVELNWLCENLSLPEGKRRSFLYVGGEPGVGKSRLVDEFRIRAQIEGFRFFKSICRENDLKPFSPVISMLSYLFTELDPDMESFSRYGPDLKRLFPETYKEEFPDRYELSESEIKAARRRMFDNLISYFSDISKIEKLVLFIEDFQWADNETHEFIKFLKSYHFTGGNLILICAGQTGRDIETPDYLIEDAGCCKILRPGTEDEMADFINNIVSGIELPDDFCPRLYGETGGNYLYLEEILKSLSSAGQFTREHGRWNLKAGWEDVITVPEGIKTLLMKKLQRLESADREIARKASALGKSFLMSQIEDLAGAGPIRQQVDNLIAAGILEKSIIGREERIYFANGQLERLIYDSIDSERLETIHKDIAEYFYKLGESKEFLGRHYALAGDFEKGFYFLFESGVAAKRVFSYSQAMKFYGAASECAERHPEGQAKVRRRFKSLLGLGKTMNFIMPSDAVKPLSEALELAEENFKESSELAEAAVIAGRNFLNTGDNEKAREAFDKGLSAACASSNRGLEGEAQIGLGFVSDKMGDLKDAENRYLNALDVFAEIDFPEGSCRVLNYLGIIRKRQGDLSGAEDFYRRSLDICLQKRFSWSAMNLYGNIGNLYVSRSDYQNALQNYSRSLEISREISDRRIESINLLNIGHALNATGNLAEGETRLFEAGDKFKALGDRGSEAIVYNNLGLLYYRKEQMADSIKYYNLGFELAREIDQPRIKLANLVGLAENLWVIGDFANADSYAMQAVELAEEINDNEQLAIALPIQAMIKNSLGDETGTINSVRQFLDLKEDIGVPRQRIKAYLLALRYKDQLQLDTGPVEAHMEKLANEVAELYPIITVFNAAAALREPTVSNPEIWLARIDQAMDDSAVNFQYRERIELMALKIKFLKLVGDNFKVGIQEEKLNREILRSTVGLKEELIDNFRKHLGIKGDSDDHGEIIMNKVNRNERLAVLLRIAQTINSIRESEPLLNKILDLALETLGGERGFIMLYSADSLDTVVARNIAREDIFGETTISQSSALEVAETGRPILLSSTDNDVSARQSVADFRISSLLCVPLAVKGKVHGIVYVDSRSGKIFSDDDLEFLTSFADLAAIALENVRMAEQLKDKNVYLQKQVESIWGFGAIVGRSSPMQKVFRMAESVADTDVTVVLTGDSGTGKEILARAIHLASPRKNAKFVPVDCGALTETLLESELFGHIKGSFTGATSDRAGLFEVAQGGTIFLDEITNTSHNFQVKLLRVLQENEIRRVGESKPRKIDVRVITATNKTLESEVEEGSFREDLYYRLNVVNIVLPPLQERREDIPVLASYFLEKICKKMNLPLKNFSSAALDLLMQYSWPGNVRQLENVCERMVVFTRDELIEVDMLPPEINSFKLSDRSKTTKTRIPKTKSELKAEKAKLDKLFIVNLLEKTDGNVMQAARLSGMDRSQIHHMMSKFGINSGDFKE